jgi:hypothetical protein
MACETFTAKRFQTRTLDLIGKMNDIVANYMDRGFVLTLRQLFYQLVARTIIENHQSDYKRVGSIVNDARLAGLMDWDGIEDRTRHLRKPPWWTSPSDVIAAAAKQYREDLWRDQTIRFEVWIEKDALLGVIESVCQKYRVPYFTCRGNNSQSEAYRANHRIRDQLSDGLTAIILCLSDHDSNGSDMTHDVRSRFAFFAGQPVDVRRIALNMDRVERYAPSPSFAKESDSRFSNYVRQFGRDCVELDALDPDVIAGLIKAEIDEAIDAKAWDSALADEQRKRSLLIRAAVNRTLVEEFVEGPIE